jgi:hypothetical protein
MQLFELENDFISYIKKTIDLQPKQVLQNTNHFLKNFMLIICFKKLTYIFCHYIVTKDSLKKLSNIEYYNDKAHKILLIYYY